MADPAQPSSMSYADVIALTGVCLTFLTFVIQSVLESLSRRKADAAALSATKIQIYQTLEIESNSIFRFEAEHKYILPYFKSNLAPAGLYERSDIMDKDQTLVTEAEMKLLARKYYELTCNLFEVASRLRKAGVADAEVFGSWVAWYFDTLLEWGFRAAWDGLRDNYTRDLRRIFDPFVATLRKDWDAPHGNGENLPIFDAASDTGRKVDGDAIEALREDFYQHVATLFGKSDEMDPIDREAERLRATGEHYAQCIYVRDWLKTARDTAPTIEHPMAYE